MGRRVLRTAICVLTTCAATARAAIASSPAAAAAATDAARAVPAARCQCVCSGASNSNSDWGRVWRKTQIFRSLWYRVRCSWVRGIEKWHRVEGRNRESVKYGFAQEEDDDVDEIELGLSGDGNKDLHFYKSGAMLKQLSREQDRQA